MRPPPIQNSSRQSPLPRCAHTCAFIGPPRRAYWAADATLRVYLLLNCARPRLHSASHHNACKTANAVVEFRPCRKSKLVACFQLGGASVDGGSNRMNEQSKQIGSLVDKGVVRCRAAGSALGRRPGARASGRGPPGCQNASPLAPRRPSLHFLLVFFSRNTRPAGIVLGFCWGAHSV